MKPTLGVVVAMASEARAVLGRKPQMSKNGQRVWHQHLKDDTHLIVNCAGVGVENALIASHGLISRGVNALASIGLSGGLDPRLKTGHIVIAVKLLQFEDENLKGPWHATAAGVALARDSLIAEGLPVHCGTTLTTSRGILTCAHKESLFRQTRALAVDMESAAVACTAQLENIPFFSLRVICDPAQATVSRELSLCLNHNGNVRLQPVVRNLTRQPSMIFDLLRLGRYYAAARSALKAAWRIQIKNNLMRELMLSNNRHPTTLYV
jgi:nucleoside phosphorylase